LSATLLSFPGVGSGLTASACPRCTSPTCACVVHLDSRTTNPGERNLTVLLILPARLLVGFPEFIPDPALVAPHPGLFGNPGPPRSADTIRCQLTSNPFRGYQNGQLMTSLVGFEPAESGHNPEDANGNPVPVGVWGDSNIGVSVFGTTGVGHLPGGRVHLNAGLVTPQQREKVMETHQ
jgi:hypothetical protein